MPVKRRSVGAADAGRFHLLADELAGELKNPKEFGQPLIDEEAFARTGLIAVTVIWDKWAGVPELKRPGVILDAYENARGGEERDRIAFAIGMTVDEAVEEGKLPYAILPQLRQSDAVNSDAIKAAMLEFGGVACEGDFPAVLRFPTLADAIACRERLVHRLPGTEELWSIVTAATRPEWAS